MSDRRTSPPDDVDPDETKPVSPESGSATLGDVPTGRAWGDLRLLNQIGQGGFGHVYRAWDENLAREVALKIIKPRDGAHRADVLREGQMLARIKHPHVVTVFRAQQVGDEVGLTMELIKGRHLTDVVKDSGPMSAEEAAVIGINLCQALAAVHGAGLLHRDVKTRNVMREAGGRIVLVDLGAGRDASPMTSVRRSDVIGTLLYLAPELFAGGTASPASDLYSLGVLLFFVVTGEYPVQGKTILDLTLKHSAGERRLLSDLRPDLPTAFVQVVDRALAPKPEQRYQTAGALMRDLTYVVHEQPVPVQPAPTPPSPSSSSVLWKWVVAIVGATVVIGILGFLTTAHYNGALDRPADMTGEGLGTWLEYGVRSMVWPVIVTWAVHLTALSLVAIWHFTRRAAPRLGRATDLARSSISERLAPDAASIAQGLLLLQIAAIAMWVWGFWPLLANLPIKVRTASPESIALLDAGDANTLLYMYRTMLTPVLAVGAVSWWWLLVKSPGRASVPRGTAVAGIAALAVCLLLLEIPWRLFYRSKAPMGTHNAQTCFEIGKDSDESLLYCPNSEKERITTVKSGEFLKNNKAEVRIFSRQH